MSTKKRKSYFRYLRTDESVPRSTAYTKRKKKKIAEEADKSSRQSVNNVETNNRSDEDVEIESDYIS